MSRAMERGCKKIERRNYSRVFRTLRRRIGPLLLRVAVLAHAVRAFTICLSPRLLLDEDL